jgi:hypothetical protein
MIADSLISLTHQLSKRPVSFINLTTLSCARKPKADKTKATSERANNLVLLIKND